MMNFNDQFFALDGREVNNDPNAVLSSRGEDRLLVCTVCGCVVPFSQHMTHQGRCPYCTLAEDHAKSTHIK
jgi:hypothetical protein